MDLQSSFASACRISCEMTRKTVNERRSGMANVVQDGDRAYVTTRDAKKTQICDKLSSCDTNDAEEPQRRFGRGSSQAHSARHCWHVVPE